MRRFIPDGDLTKDEIAARRERNKIPTKDLIINTVLVSGWAYCMANLLIRVIL